MPAIRRVVPNENFEFILEFDDRSFRIFPASVARKVQGFEFLAYPNKLKNFLYNPEAVIWGEGQSLSAEYLYQNSKAITGPELLRQALTLGFMNRAPTRQHRTHHVYVVNVFPFNRDEPFCLGESLVGGIAEDYRSREYSLEGLISDPGWKTHFELSGCAWAIEMIERAPRNTDAVIDRLVKAVSVRGGQR